MARPRATYILPLRKKTNDDLVELTEYLHGLKPLVDVVIVDNSDRDAFSRHQGLWNELGVHVPPDADCLTENQKVGNVTTGVRRAKTELLIVADDDVRYIAETLDAVIDRLSAADIVRPANFFAPLIWHAALDTARTLLNRVSGGDWPGTLAFRKSAFLRAGGYAGNVLFENYELVRSIVRAGGVALRADDVYVKRLPPSARHFWSQRVRQAYDEFARPPRLVFFLLLVPALIFCLRRHQWGPLALSAVAIVGAAEAGRRRHGGARVFPMSCSLLAPVWLLERAICSWLAVYQRIVFGGVSYNGRRLKNAASP